MTVTYTTLLSLAKPTTGTESGNWGNVVNNALTSYLDISIAGTLSLTSANFSAGAVTIADTQGTNLSTGIVSTTAQYAAIKVSSLATNSTITAPSSSRIYLVDNADSTYTVTIKASGQTGYTVAKGTKAIVYYNGTDYVLASTNDILKLSNAGAGVITAIGIDANATGGFPTTDGVATLSNKRVNPRVSTTASAASVTPDVASYDQYCFTAQAATLTINAPIGTPVEGNKLIFRILDNGTSRTLTWNATYTPIGVALPTATTINKMLYVGCIYNVANTRWDVIAVTTQI